MTEKQPHEMTEGELARYYEERKDDKAFWHRDNFKRVDLRLGGKPPSTIFTMRIDPRELTRIANAAHESGLSASEFVRRVCFAAIEDRTRLDAAEHARAKAKVKEQVEALAEAVSKL